MQKEILTLRKLLGFDHLALSIEVTEGEISWGLTGELVTQILDEFHRHLLREYTYVLALTKCSDGTLRLSIKSIKELVLWKVSDELKTQIIDELKSRLGGEHTYEFDSAIEDAIDAIRS